MFQNTVFMGIRAGFRTLSKYHMQNWGENIFKEAFGNESLHQGSNDNGIRIVNVITSKI